jgi:hypothetical protein
MPVRPSRADVIEGAEGFSLNGGKLTAFTTSKASGKMYKPTRDIRYIELIDMTLALVAMNTKEYDPDAATNGVEIRTRYLKSVFMPAFENEITGITHDFYDNGRCRHTGKIEYNGYGAGYTLKGPMQDSVLPFAGRAKMYMCSCGW